MALTVWHRLRRRTGVLSIGLIALTLTAGYPSPGQAQDKSTGSIAISNPRSRETPPAARVGVGYLTIANNGTETDRLIGVSSPVADRVELHQTTVEGTITRMLPVRLPLEIGPGRTVVLEPGGMHLMLVQLNVPIRPEAGVPVELQFERAGSRTVQMTVEPLHGSRGTTGHGGRH